MDMKNSLFKFTLHYLIKAVFYHCIKVYDLEMQILIENMTI